MHHEKGIHNRSLYQFSQPFHDQNIPIYTYAYRETFSFINIDLKIQYRNLFSVFINMFFTYICLVFHLYIVHFCLHLLKVHIRMNKKGNITINYAI